MSKERNWYSGTVTEALARPTAGIALISSAHPSSRSLLPHPLPSPSTHSVYRVCRRRRSGPLYEGNKERGKANFPSPEKSWLAAPSSCRAVLLFGCFSYSLLVKLWCVTYCRHSAVLCETTPQLRECRFHLNPFWISVTTSFRVVSQSPAIVCVLGLLRDERQDFSQHQFVSV